LVSSQICGATAPVKMKNRVFENFTIDSAHGRSRAWWGIWVGWRRRKTLMSPTSIVIFVPSGPATCFAAISKAIYCYFSIKNTTL